MRSSITKTDCVVGPSKPMLFAGSLVDAGPEVFSCADMFERFAVVGMSTGPVLDALDHGLRQRNFTGGGFSGDAVGGFFGDVDGDAAAIFEDDGVVAGGIHRAGQHETEREERHV